MLEVKIEINRAAAQIETRLCGAHPFPALNLARQQTRQRRGRRFDVQVNFPERPQITNAAGQLQIHIRGF